MTAQHPVSDDNDPHGDAVWFAERPARSHRLRRASRHEIDEEGTNDPYTLIRQIEPGVRLRLGIKPIGNRAAFEQLLVDAPDDQIPDELLRIVCDQVLGSPGEPAMIDDAVVELRGRALIGGSA